MGPRDLKALRMLAGPEGHHAAGAGVRPVVAGFTTLPWKLELLGPETMLGDGGSKAWPKAGFLMPQGYWKDTDYWASPPEAPNLKDGASLGIFISTAQAPHDEKSGS